MHLWNAAQAERILQAVVPVCSHDLAVGQKLPENGSRVDLPRMGAQALQVRVIATAVPTQCFQRHTACQISQFHRTAGLLKGQSTNGCNLICATDQGMPFTAGRG